MTPAARVAAAIEILDLVLADTPAEKVLTNWARSNRFAGSGDRAAIRDHVFDALRRRQTFAALGGSDTGRGLMIGALRNAETPLDGVFSGEGYAPSPLTDEEISFNNSDISDEINLNLPEWLVPSMRTSLGDDFEETAQLLQERAPLYLRANLGKSTRSEAITSLKGEEIGAEANDLSPTAILITKNPRRVQNSVAYRDGQVEIQDAASQAIVDQLPLKTGDNVLDYCAGGGGKALAMLARADIKLTAHDVLAQRMKDIPFRAGRAGVYVKVVTDSETLDAAGYELVLCDVPCTGSGSWRRSPQAKWSLTQERLDELRGVQADILKQSQGLVAKGGVLAYVTCSLLDEENGDQIKQFLGDNPTWKLQSEKTMNLQQGGDGFYVALLTRE